MLPALRAAAPARGVCALRACAHRAAAPAEVFVLFTEPAEVLVLFTEPAEGRAFEFRNLLRCHHL